MPLRNEGPLVRAMAALVAIALAGATPARAQDLTIVLPTLTAPPGATVLVPIVTSPGPAGLGVTSVEFRMDFTPGVIASSSSQADGWLQSWGPAFVNANASFLAAAAAGFPATSASGGLLNTVSLTISPSAPAGTDMPLAFQHLLLNEGSPTVAVTPGVLRIRTSAGVGDAPAGRFALAAPVPNPASRAASLSLVVPAGDGGTVRLAVLSVDGRLVRELANGPLATGTHAVAWDLRDANGAPVAPGLYFATAARGAERAVRRVVVTR